MNLKLVTYEYVPSGFEMIINNLGVTEKEEIKAWNLWFNITGTDDPEAWDKEIRLINEMQNRLSELTMDQRLIRAQIAEFCREHPFFPQSIDILCKEIGDGCFSKPVKIGCLGRGLLVSLGYHKEYLQSLNNLRKNYARSLKKWLVQAEPKNPTELKVFYFLGQPTAAKKAFLEKLISIIDSEAFLLSSLKKLLENECMETQGESTFKTFSSLPLYCFNCSGCPEACFMLIDAGIMYAQFGEIGRAIDEFSRFGEEYALGYSVAINSWLKEATPKPVTSLITTRYITKDNALEIAERVHSSLREKDETKEWLAVCLLKTIKHKRYTARKARAPTWIDNFPEATSWFKEPP